VNVQQLSITDAPLRRTTDPDTSQAPSPRRLSAGRWTALETLHRHPDGLTDFELAAITCIAQTSIGCRRKDLARMDPALVVDSGERRPSPTGASAIVWRITPAGVATYREMKA
jgi:hypothetical protein